jgi:ribonuclease HII
MKTSLSFVLERERFSAQGIASIGVDEVGRGCLAGPVVAAAVMFDWSKPEIIVDLGRRVAIHDSKTLSRARRKASAAAIRDVAIGIGVAEIDAATIDEINILQATLRAMKFAVEQIENREGSMVLVDGNQRIRDLALLQETIVDGDAKIFSIAAASLVAKEYRDSLMEQFDQTHPGYDFSSHKGYGTKKHCEAIRKIGISPIHRVSFWHG